MAQITETPWFKAMSAVIGILVGIVQIALLGYVGHLDSTLERHESKINEFERFMAATSASRYTSQDANQMNTLLLQEIRDVEASLKECINRVILDGNRARC